MFDPHALVEWGEQLGAQEVRVLAHRIRAELYVLDNGTLRQGLETVSMGVGVRVVAEGGVGYAAANDVSEGGLRGAVERAYRIARAMARAGRRARLAERPANRARLSSPYSIDPADVDPSEKVGLLADIHGELRGYGLSSVVLSYAHELDERWVVSSAGDDAAYARRMVGISMSLVASSSGSVESLRDQRSSVAGWEFVKGFDWRSLARENAQLLLRSLEAPHVEPGRYAVVLDNEAVGLLIHEAFGHASEADIVLSGGSVLEGKVGEQVASELVSISDDGLVEGGAWIPIDDEGTPKSRTRIVERGILRGYLHSLATAGEMGAAPTGNARAMDYTFPVQVRQTNIYVEPGDWRPEEMIADVRRGIYVRGKGARGGEVDPLSGTFTFTAGPSQLIRDGEEAGLVRGVILSGSILETLRGVDAVGRDLAVTTSVFGGCGKGGQMVRVGDGGPHVRVREMVVGG
ncbi:MAG: TldD/PmbA family protein [Desulfurococcaceae archaeon]